LLSSAMWHSPTSWQCGGSHRCPIVPALVSSQEETGQLIQMGGISTTRNPPKTIPMFRMRMSPVRIGSQPGRG
jgi:hypothetical protein